MTGLEANKSRSPVPPSDASNKAAAVTIVHGRAAGSPTQGQPDEANTAAATLSLRNVVVPVKWGELSKQTFTWYAENLHRCDHFVHVCHVPNFRSHITAGMTPMQVLEVMIEFNSVADQLQLMYEALMAEKKIKGKFVRVGSNKRWMAIVEYCKLVDATLIVIGTQPKPERPCPQFNIDLATAVDTDFMKAESGRARVSVRSSQDASSSFRDCGPFVATVPHDVIQHCSATVAVYRQPTATDGRCRFSTASTKRRSTGISTKGNMERTQKNS